MDFEILADDIYLNDFTIDEIASELNYDSIDFSSNDEFPDIDIFNCDILQNSRTSSCSTIIFDSELENDIKPEPIYENSLYIENHDNMQRDFISYVKRKELDLFNESFVEDYFTNYPFPFEDILKKTRTQLWMDNCIYGIQFQAYICMKNQYPLPIVQQRNRKNPIIQKDFKAKRKGIANDEILEQLLRSCKSDCQEIKMRPRDAPRNQIGMLIFLLDLLNHPYYQTCIKWEDRKTLTFKILNSKLVAYYWMIVKENDTCNFENFARGIRYLRHSGFFKPIDKKKQRTYQFNKKAIKEYKIKRHNNQLSTLLFNNLEKFCGL